MPCPKLASGMRALLMIAMTSLKKSLFQGSAPFRIALEFNSRAIGKFYAIMSIEVEGSRYLCGTPMLFSSSEEFELTKGLSIFDELWSVWIEGSQTFGTFVAVVASVESFRDLRMLHCGSRLLMVALLFPSFVCSEL